MRKSLQDHEHQHGCTSADPSRESELSAHDPSSTTNVVAEDDESIRNLPVDRRPVILVLEDNDQARFVVRAFLERKGYSVVEAKDETEAISVCARADQRIDLLISDVTLK